MKEQNKQGPLISVVIPCYNQGQYLKDSIGSIKAQTFKNYEIILVNDGSTEVKTIKIIDKVETEQPDVIVINKKNGGLSEARNSGIKVARGKYILCLDADDKIESDYLKRSIEVFEESKKANLGFVTSWVQEFGDRSNVWKTEDFNAGKLLIINLVHAGSVFKKEVWEKVGGYKKIMKGGYEDWEFWISAVEEGYSWELIKKPLFDYRIRKESMLSGAFKRHMELYERIVNLHPEVFKKYADEIAIYSAKITYDLRASDYSRYLLLVESNEELEKTRRLNMELNADLHTVRSELDDLVNSRVIKQAIYIRNKLRKIRSIIN